MIRMTSRWMPRWALAAAMTCGVAHGALKLPEKIRAQSAELMMHLEKANGDWAGEEVPFTLLNYFSGLEHLGYLAAKDPAVKKALAEGGAETAQEILVLLAVKFRDPEEQKRIAELRDWYGCYSYDIKDSTVDAFLAANHLPGVGGIPSKETAMRMHTGPQVHSLMNEHLRQDYLIAWEIWFMAPAEGEKRLMRTVVDSALLGIGDPSCVPLLLEVYRFKMERAGDQGARGSVAANFGGLIGRLPCSGSLNALLDFNRQAIAGGYAGQGWTGYTRQVVRRLSSLSPYVDSERDPEIASMPRDVPPRYLNRIPRTDDNWKIYKPLIEAKLKAADKNTPPEDLDLLKQAMEAMPEE